MTRPQLILLRWKIETQNALFRSVPYFRAFWHRLVRIALYPIPKYTRPPLYIQAGLVLATDISASFWQIPPGVAIGLLAAVAVIVAVRTDHVTTPEKVAWIVMSFGMFGFEVHAIYHERDLHEKEQAEIDRQQREQFAHVLEQNQRDFSATLDGLRGLFKNEQQLAEQTSNQITGGSSFAEVQPMFIPDPKFPNRFPLLLHVKGKFDLLDVIVEIRELPIPNEGSISDVQNYIAGVGVNRIVVGAVSHAWAQIINGYIQPDPNKLNDYSINVLARNGSTHESLKVRVDPATHRWQSSFNVIREVNGRNITLDKSKPDWRGWELLPPKK